MRKSMTASSKLSKTTFSPETEKLIIDVISRVVKFSSEADSILSQYQLPTVVEGANLLIENIFTKFHSIVKEISERHQDRSTLEINDEFDVQDLLRGLLRLHFDDVRYEEYTPSYAGSSARMDLLLKNEKIVIETKMIRKNLGQKRVREELIIDKAYYKGLKDCRTLYCFVYDPEEKIRNPRGFENDLSDKTETLETKVFVVSK